MTRYYLGVMMLALGAAGVVWIAVEQQSPKKSVVPATTEPTTATAPVSAAPRETATVMPSPETTPAPPEPEDAQAGDAGEVDAAPNANADAGGDSIFPPLAVYAAWSVVRWGMSAPEVEAAFREAGLGVVDATEGDAKNRGRRVRASRTPWEATVEIGSKGAEQVVVTATNLSKEDAQAALARVTARAPATKTVVRSERRWKKEGAASTSLVTFADGTTSSMREEHVRERAPGGWLGFAGLRWGMSTQEVVGMLTHAGYGAHVLKAPSTSHSDTVPFSKGDVEGTASFNQFGLRHMEVTSPSVESAPARAKQLETSLGKSASFESSTKTQHVDHARMTSIEVELTEKEPGTGLTVVETYRPK